MNISHRTTYAKADHVVADLFTLTLPEGVPFNAAWDACRSPGCEDGWQVMGSCFFRTVDGLDMGATGAAIEPLDINSLLFWRKSADPDEIHYHNRRFLVDPTDAVTADMDALRVGTPSSRWVPIPVRAIFAADESYEICAVVKSSIRGRGKALPSRPERDGG